MLIYFITFLAASDKILLKRPAARKMPLAMQMISHRPAVDDALQHLTRLFAATARFAYIIVRAFYRYYEAALFRFAVVSSRLISEHAKKANIAWPARFSQYAASAPRQRRLRHRLSFACRPVITHARY